MVWLLSIMVLITIADSELKWVIFFGDLWQIRRSEHTWNSSWEFYIMWQESFKLTEQVYISFMSWVFCTVWHQYPILYFPAQVLHCLDESILRPFYMAWLLFASNFLISHAHKHFGIPYLLPRLLEWHKIGLLHTLLFRAFQWYIGEDWKRLMH